MPKTIENTVTTEASISDDGTHRYSLTKIWDETKPVATIIMLYPCTIDILESDLTTMIVLNNIAKLGYGAVNLLNVFSQVNVNFNLDMSVINHSENDETITNFASQSDTVIIAWGKRGTSSRKVSQREVEVFKLLKPCEDKVFVLEDEQGKTGLHPLTPSLRNRFKLVKFVLPEQKSEGKEAADKAKKKGKNKSKPEQKEAQGLPEERTENEEPQTEAV